MAMAVFVIFNFLFGKEQVHLNYLGTLMPKLNGMPVMPPVAQLAPTNKFLGATIKSHLLIGRLGDLVSKPAGWLVVTCGKDETCPSCKG
jgi:hypothetical protein